MRFGVAMAKMIRAICHLVLFVPACVDESPKGLSIIEASPELKLSLKISPKIY